MNRSRLLCPTLIILIFTLAFVNSGCYTYRIMDTPIGDNVVPNTTTEWSFFWGLQQAEEKKMVCEEGGIANFKVVHNLGFSLISIATLGIANPMRIEWMCQPEEDSHDTLD